MSDQSFSKLLDSVEQYLELENCLGREYVEVNSSILEKLNEEESSSEVNFSYIKEGNINVHQLLFLGVADKNQASVYKGKTGILLKKIVSAMGYKLQDILVVLINPSSLNFSLKNNLSNPFQSLIDNISPKIIVSLGDKPIVSLINKKINIKQVHGKWIDGGKFKIMPIYDLQHMLQHVESKKETWKALQEVINIKGISNNN